MDTLPSHTCTPSPLTHAHSPSPSHCHSHKHTLPPPTHHHVLQVALVLAVESFKGLAALFSQGSLNVPGLLRLQRKERSVGVSRRGVG